MFSRSILPSQKSECHLTVVILLTSGLDFLSDFCPWQEAKKLLGMLSMSCPSAQSACSFHLNGWHWQTLMTYGGGVKGYPLAGWLWLLPDFWPSFKTWCWSCSCDSELWPKLVTVLLYSQIGICRLLGNSAHTQLWAVTPGRRVYLC